MEDIPQALRTVTRTAGEVGMTRDDLRKATDLLQKYDDERSRLFDEMLALLGRSDPYGIPSDWKDKCEKGQALLDRLNGDLPKSPKGEGFDGVGALYFYQGEKKVWEENGKAQIAMIAEVMAKVLAANLALIKQCNDDLKTVRDGDAALQSLINQNLGGIKDDILDISKTVASKLGEKVLTSWMKEGAAKDYAKKWYKLVVQRAEENFNAAKQKGLFKKQILDNIELLKKAKEQLDEKWIDDLYRTAEDWAKSLAGRGETGDYRALDWARFADSCTKPVAERRDDAKEKSKAVFNELLPTFLEENNRAFAAMTDDPSTLSDWKSDMQDQFRSIEDVLQSEDQLIKELAEGPYQQAARETFEEFRLTISTGMKLLFDRTKDAEDEMRK